MSWPLYRVDRTIQNPHSAFQRSLTSSGSKLVGTPTLIVLGGSARSRGSVILSSGGSVLAAAAGLAVAAGAALAAAGFAAAGPAAGAEPPARAAASFSCSVSGRPVGIGAAGRGGAAGASGSGA